MLTDHPGKALLFFALPMIFGNLFQQLYNITDSVIVGRFVGENALAAVGALLIWGATVIIPAQQTEVAAQAATATASDSNSAPATASAGTENTGAASNATENTASGNATNGNTVAPLWQVQQGTLGISVQQSGSPVAGQFGQWQAHIDYDPDS